MNNAEKTLNILTEMGVSHTVKQCANSTTVKVDGGRGYYFPNSGEQIEAKYINFITKTKKEVCYNASKMKLKELNPKYIRFSPLFSHQFDYGYGEFSEIDINGAYWKCAFNMGFISGETYTDGLRVPKMIRLMALGAAATTKEVFYYNGSEYIYEGLEYDPAGRMAFFTISKEIDDIMNEAINLLHGNAAFYWVDALFVRSKFVDVATEIINHFGYETKVINLAHISCNPEKGQIRTVKINYENDKICEIEFKTYQKVGKFKQKKP